MINKMYDNYLRVKKKIQYRFEKVLLNRDQPSSFFES